MKITIENCGYLVQVISSRADRTFKIVEMKGEHPNISTRIVADDISEDDAYENEVEIRNHNENLSFKKYQTLLCKDCDSNSHCIDFGCTKKKPE